MENLDQSLFVFFNSTLSNPVFDWFFPFFTDLHKNKFFIFGFFPCLLFFWAYKKRWQMLPVLVGLSICIGLVDNFTHRVMKPIFERPRPPQMEKIIELRTDRYGGYSFPSNHAANNFAGASFLSLCYPALSPVFYAVASLVAFSRVYVGVHYPGDILAGGLFGLFFGLFFYRIWVIIWLRASQRWPLLHSPAMPTAVGDTDDESKRKL